MEEDSHYGEEEVETPELRSEEDKDNEEFSVEDYMPEDEIPGYRLQTNNYSPDDRQVDIPFSVGDTFHEYLQQQAEMENFSDRELQLAKYILGNIDEDGYLRRDLLSISDDLAFHLNMDVQEEELEKILRVIQGFDPPGVGARNLQESLLLQLERRNSEHRILATTIIRDHFEEFTRRHYDKITRRLNVDDEELKQAIDLILKLNPKPGSSYSNPHNKSNQHIVPDFILEVIDGELQLSLNQRNMPELRINESYLDMLRSLAGPKSNGSRNNREAASFVRQKLDSAKWFIDAIRQRQHTLLATMSEIIDFQKSIFRMGTRPG